MGPGTLRRASGLTAQAAGYISSEAEEGGLDMYIGIGLGTLILIIVLIALLT